jgi:O-antigen/teichoic acid export membrane protein
LTETLKLVGFVTMWLLGSLTVLSAVLITAASGVVSGLVYLVLLRRKLDWNADPGEVPFRRVLKYAGEIWIGSLSGILLTRLSQVVMTPLAGATELGYYAAAVNVSDVALLANNAVRDVTLSSDSAERLTARATRSARSSFFVSAVVGLLLLGSIPLWFDWFFGAEFAPGKGLAAILIVANVLGVPGSVAGAVLSARGKPGRRSFSLTVAAVVNICILLVAVPSIGAIGAAIGALVGNLVASNMNIFFAWRILGISPREFYLVGADDVRAVVRVGLRFLGKGKRGQRGD